MLKTDENGVENIDISAAVYDSLGDKDSDPHTYVTMAATGTKTKPGTGIEASDVDSNNAGTVMISGVSIERAMYKVILGLLLFCTLFCTLSGVIVYHVISAKMADNGGQTSQHTEGAPKPNISGALAKEFSQFTNVWEKQLNSQNDNISELRDHFTESHSRLDIMDNALDMMDAAVQAIQATQNEIHITLDNYNKHIERRLDQLDKDLMALQGKQNSGHNTETDDWELIFRATAGNGDNVYKAWTTGEKTTDIKPSSMQRGNSCHYRNTPNITEWNNVQYVKYNLFQNGREVAFITFNGTGSTYMDWFERSRVMDSSWCPINCGIDNYNYFSIVGDRIVARRFFVNQHYNGCPNDKGYTVVSDTDSPKHCLFDTHDSYPQFLYSTNKGTTQWDNLMYGKADYMAVFYKHG